MTLLEDSSTRSWESVADEWVSHADSNDYRNHFLMPLTLEMLGDVNQRTILDLGCGEGGYSRELARRGAKVVAVDGSARLIEVASRRAAVAHLAARFLCANASHMPQVVSSSFDLVLATMSLMDVEDYPGAMSEIVRVLRPQGELLMSITHPCFTAPVSRWIRNQHGEAQYFAVDRYLERTAWDDWMANNFTRPVLRIHRPLEDYMTGALRAGLELREFREPDVSEEMMKKSARFWKLKRIPYFLFLRWSKT